MADRNPFPENMVEDIVQNRYTIDIDVLTPVPQHRIRPEHRKYSITELIEDFAETWSFFRARTLKLSK